MLGAWYRRSLGDYYGVVGLVYILEVGVLRNYYRLLLNPRLDFVYYYSIYLRMIPYDPLEHLEILV